MIKTFVKNTAHTSHDGKSNETINAQNALKHSWALNTKSSR